MKKLIFLAFAILLASATVAAAQDVRYNFDNKATFPSTRPTCGLTSGTPTNPQPRLSERPSKKCCKDVCRVSPSGTKTRYQEFFVAKEASPVTANLLRV
jgi:hypothetical protein